MWFEFVKGIWNTLKAFAGCRILLIQFADEVPDEYFIIHDTDLGHTKQTINMPVQRCLQEGYPRNQKGLTFNTEEFDLFKKRGDLMGISP